MRTAVLLLLALLWLPPSLVAATISVAAGGDLQAALDAAKPGDRVELADSAAFTGNFFLPNKVASVVLLSEASYITITRSGTVLAVCRMLEASCRTSFLSAAASFPVIRTINSAPALQADLGAHHYRFIGIDIQSGYAQRAYEVYNLVLFGSDRQGNPATVLTDLPHHIEFDRVYLHGNATGNLRRGLTANANNVVFKNSYCTDIHVEGNGDTQCIGAWNAAGPMLIDNNVLEAAGENILIGGDYIPIANLVTSDVTFTHNLVTKKLSWKPTDPSYAGIPWSVKTLFEMKNVQRLLVEGNVFERQWAAIFEYALVMRPGSQNGQNPWATIKDVTIRGNIFRDVAAGINISALDDGGASVRADNIQITNDLFINLGFGGGSGQVIQLLNGPTNVLIDHITAYASNLGSSLISLGNLPQGTNLIIRNGLYHHKSYGVFGSGVGTGTVALSTYFSSWAFLKNVLASDESNTPSLYTAGNFFPSVAAYAGSFVDAAGGDFHLTPTSIYRNAGTDGKDLGVDFVALEASLNGAITPVPPPPLPPPPPPTPCAYAVVVSQQLFDRAGGNANATITTAAGCPWALTENADWITESPGSGLGARVVTLQVKRYNGRGSRTAGVAIGGQAFTIQQQGR